MGWYSMTILGTDATSQRLVELTAEDRRQGTYIIGTNGSGKSNLLQDIVLQDLQAGDGLCLLDPHGDLVEAVLARIPDHRIDDVVLFDPADIDHPFGLNLLECPDVSNPRLVDLVCSEVVVTFHKLFAESWGPRMEDVIRHTILALVYGTPDATMLDMLIFLTSDERRAEYVARVTDPVILHYWQDVFPNGPKDKRRQDDWTSSTLNKLGRFLVNPLMRNIVSQPQSTFDIGTIMNEGKVLLVNLAKGRLGEDNSSLLGSVLVGKLLISALGRAELNPRARRPFHLIVDEFHSFATENFPTLQSEARKFAIDTIVAHQYRDQLDDLNRGSTLNVGNFILFRTSGRDAYELAMQFDNTPPPGDVEMRATGHRTSRPGALRPGDPVLAEGTRRTFGDLTNEKANQLANAPNYHARCRLLVGGFLEERFIKTRLIATEPDPRKAKYVRDRAEELGTPRADVEKLVRQKYGGVLPAVFDDDES